MINLLQSDFFTNFLCKNNAMSMQEVTALMGDRHESMALKNQQAGDRAIEKTVFQGVTINSLILTWL